MVKWFLQLPNEPNKLWIQVISYSQALDVKEKGGGQQEKFRKPKA